MWNVSALSVPQTLTCKMTGELAILLTFMVIGIPSTHSLAEAAALVIEPELPTSCRLLKCSAGYHSVCQSNGQPRCKQCSDGFYSSHASRKKACRRCSHCEDNEFEVHPCSPTSDVVCQKCRECSSRFEFVLKSCTRTSDTICGNCSSVLGLGCVKEQHPQDFSSQHKDKPGWVKHHAWTKRKFHVEEIPIEIRVQPTLQSSTIILHSSIAMGKISTAFVSYHDHIETSTRSILETRKAADTLTRTKSPTRTLAPASYSSIRKNETAVYSDSGKAMRNRRWHAQNETRNMTDVLSLPKNISHEPRDPPTVAAGVTFSPHFDRDKTTTSYEFSPSTASNTVGKAPFDMETSGPPLKTVRIRIAIFVISGIAIVLIVSLFLAKKIKRRRFAHRGFHGHLFSQAERGTWRPRCPQSRNCCIEVQGIRALNSFDSDDSPPSSTQVTVTSYLSEEVKPVYHIFPEDQRIRSEPLFVTSAHDIFDNNGGKLTHPDSDICINIEPGTFPDGRQQPIFFHVIYDDTHVIRDIPETNKRTLISPVIKCGPEDINPHKAVEIVLPHCLYMDEVKKGSIEVYRCGQYTSEGQQKWEIIPSSSERSCHSKAWFSIKKDRIVIKTKFFSIWSVFVCGAGGSKRKRITAFASKPNPASNLISLRCYIYSDNEDSKRKVERLEKERFPGTKPVAAEKPFKLFSDDQDINVWLDEDALTAKGWMLDEIPASQIYSYEMAYRNGFRSKYACEFPVKPISDCLTGVKDFSCGLHFQQIGRTKDFIYVNPGIPLLPLQATLDVNGSNSYEAQSQNLSSQASNSVVASEFEIPEDLRKRCDEPVTQEDCVCICYHIVNWKMFLQHLKVSEVFVKNLDEDHRCLEEKCYRGLLKWTRSAGAQGATMRNLCIALIAAGCTEAIEKLSSRDSYSPGFVVPEELRMRLHRDDPVTRQDCIRLCDHIVNDWKMILRHLGVEEAVLENVDANHLRANEKSYQGLLEWTRLAGTQGATLRKLCNALRAVNCTEAIEKLSSRDDGVRLPTHAIPETV
ncbi:uncharacterized protein [Acropora muricata]|uniref:uncharacterized protein isoform X2 n=1 Tax=Acropora muricata TaxID=159855 RepID=UPI0034E4CEFB